jgi:hypothetical protein
MIEQKIIIGFLTNTSFITEIEEEWDSKYIESSIGKLLCNWSLEYFKTYKKAPKEDIETILLTKIKEGLDEEIAEEINEDILPLLSKEYEKEKDPTFLIDEARVFFKERQIQLHSEQLTNLIENNKVEEAINLISNFKLKQKLEYSGLDLSKQETIEKVERAFDETYQKVISFPGAFGEFINDELVRGGLISILAPEKRGKTQALIEFMMRAYMQKKKVAFFQAGDMTENQLIMRLCIYLTQRSNKEKYCGTRYIPVPDCIYNQKDTCTKKVRECDFGLFGEEIEGRDDITKEQLLQALEDNPNYKPCHNCSQWGKNTWGTPWLKKVVIKEPLSKKRAIIRWKRFFIKAGLSIKISTHANLTLRVKDIEDVLDKWKEQENFEPDLILIDYADILASEIKGDVRERENHKWMRLRALSQRGNQPLVIVPTQADSASYKQDTLNMSNFSEDKRKNAHVTASFGLNQDSKGREKEIGIMRWNKIVVREGDLSGQVYVLQHLAIGRSFLGSYF